MKPDPRTPWEALQAFTTARIALGRAGSSLPTQAVLEFEHAHARAKDAVAANFDPERLKVLRTELEQVTGAPTYLVSSQAKTRETYLTRPDLGRLLGEDETEQLVTVAQGGPYDLAVIVGDGLSAAAPAQHAAPLLSALTPLLRRPRPLRLAPVVVARGARVALGDPIGATLGASLSLVLIGERPGLTTPESLGAYLTFAPRPSRLDAERNCVSNIHAAGLTYEAAARTLAQLIRGALEHALTGVGLKLQDGPDLLTGE